MGVIAVLNHHPLFFLSVSWLSAQSEKPAQYSWNPACCSCCPAHWDTLRAMAFQKFLRECNIFPFVRKMLFLRFGIKKGWQRITTITVFLPLPFPAPAGAMKKSREMCKAHLQCDSPEWPEFWADKDINSCKWSVLLICMQLQCRDQGKFKAIHCH